MTGHKGTQQGRGFTKLVLQSVRIRQEEAECRERVRGVAEKRRGFKLYWVKIMGRMIHNAVHNDEGGRGCSADRHRRNMLDYLASDGMVPVIYRTWLACPSGYRQGRLIAAGHAGTGMG